MRPILKEGVKEGVKDGGPASHPKNCWQFQGADACSNETHESRTDGDVRLYRKGKTATPGVKQPKA